jgi:hypothetical protein
MAVIALAAIAFGCAPKAAQSQAGVAAPIGMTTR